MAYERFIRCGSAKPVVNYYENRRQWIWMMKQSIGKIGAFFNSERMMRRYVTEAYIR